MSRSARRHYRRDAGLPALSAYDTRILLDAPIMYLPLWGGSAGASDITRTGRQGRPVNNPGVTTFLNGDSATVFNGINQYIEVADHDSLSVTKTGILTIEAWMRPDTLTHSPSLSTGYIHWMGKSMNGQSEYIARMYNATTTDSPQRPNRISGYSFNLNGGLGVGSYFQDPVTVGQWIYYVLVINTVNTSASYTTGYTKIYKNGVQRDQDALTHYSIIPGNGTAPFRVGTAEATAFLQGAVAKVAIYDYELSAATIREHHEIIRPPVSGSSAFIKNVGSATTKTTGTTLALPITSAVSAGSTLIARVAHDFTSGGPTMADSKGNTYTRDRTGPDGSSSMRASLFSAQVNAALKPGDTILLTTSAAVDAKTLIVDEFTQVTFTSPLDVTNSQSNTTATPGTSLTMTTTNADDLLIASLATKGPVDDGYTNDTILPWNALARTGTTGSTDTTNVTVAGGYKVVGSTGGYKYQPTLGTARSSVLILGSYKAGTPVIVPPVTGTAVFVQHIGTAFTQAAGTTFTLTIPAGVDSIPVGSALIVRTLTNSSGVTAPTITDNRGNTYTRDRTGPQASADMRAAIYSCIVSNELFPGDVITFTSPSSITTKVAAVDHFANLAGPIVVDAQNGTSNTSATPSNSVTTTIADDLLVSMVGVAGDVADGYTEDVIRQWTGLVRVGTTGGTFSANRTINSAYRAVGSTGTYTYGPTLATSSDWVQLTMAYKAGTPVITPPPVGTATFVQDIGTSINAASGTALTITIPAGGVPAGHTLIVRTLSDTASSPTVTDARGNTYTRDRTGPDSVPSIRAAIFSCPVTTPLQAGDLITITFPTTTNRMAGVSEFSTTLQPVTVDTQNGTSGVSTAPNVGVTTTNADDLLISVVGVASNVADSYTEDGVNLWHGVTRVGNTTRTLNGAYRSVPATGTYRYQPALGVSASWLEMIVAYRAA